MALEIDDDTTGSLSQQLMAIQTAKDPHAPVTMAVFAPVAKVASKLLEQDQFERRLRNIVRTVGGVMGGSALALGAAALNLASQASRDHEVLAEVRGDVATHAEALDTLERDIRTRQNELSTAGVRIESQLDRIDGLVTRIEHRLDGMDARIDGLEGRRPR